MYRPASGNVTALSAVDPMPTPRADHETCSLLMRRHAAFRVNERSPTEAPPTLSVAKTRRGRITILSRVPVGDTRRQAALEGGRLRSPSGQACQPGGSDRPG